MKQMKHLAIFFSTVIEFHGVKFVRKAMTLWSNNIFYNAKLAAQKHIALNSLMHLETAFQIVSGLFLEQIFNLQSAYYLLACSNRIVLWNSHWIWHTWIFTHFCLHGPPHIILSLLLHGPDAPQQRQGLDSTPCAAHPAPTLQGSTIPPRPGQGWGRTPGEQQVLSTEGRSQKGLPHMNSCQGARIPASEEDAVK